MLHDILSYIGDFTHDDSLAFRVCDMTDEGGPSRTLEPGREGSQTRSPRTAFWDLAPALIPRRNDQS
jgi:hypothetical protein